MPFQVLRGHTSPETAYVVDDYPYGFRLRCKIRYWLETATKGKGKGGSRLMSQTTNPKIPSMEIWNKPKNENVFCSFMVMFLDSENHVQARGINWHSFPSDFAAFRADFALNEDELDVLGRLESRARALSPETWARYASGESKL